MKKRNNNKAIFKLSIIILSSIILFILISGCDDRLYDYPYYNPCLYSIKSDGSGLDILLTGYFYNLEYIPNTHKILYITSDSMLCTIDYETEQVDTIFTNHNFYTILSKDGAKLVYKKNVNGEYEIFQSKIDGTDEEQLTNLPFTQKAYYSFSYDSEKIVFITEKESSKTIYSLCVLDLLSHELTTLLTIEKKLSFPIFSPDGEKIYYIRVYSDTYNFARMHVMNIDGTHLHQFNDDYVSWNNKLYITPDGGKIIYKAWDSLRVVNAEDSENISITKCDNYALSNYGDKIAYKQNYKGINCIYSINLDGSGKNLITYLTEPKYIIFLHDDKRLAFTGKYELNKESKNYITN